MGKQYESPWKTNPKYIFDLIRHLVGKDHWYRLDPERYDVAIQEGWEATWERIERNLQLLMDIVAPQVCEMKSDKLAQIIEYANGFNYLNTAPDSRFRQHDNVTFHVMADDSQFAPTGRYILELLVKATLKSIMKDMMAQKLYRRREQNWPAVLKED